MIHVLMLASLVSWAKVTTDKVIAAGEVSLDPKLEARAKGVRTLFLVLRDENSPMPMPFAAMKVELKKDASGKFHTFRLTDSNVTKMSGGDTPAKIEIKARLDRDGSAGRDSPGDLVGSAKGVNAGSTDVKITIASEMK